MESIIYFFQNIFPTRGSEGVDHHRDAQIQKGSNIETKIIGKEGLSNDWSVKNKMFDLSLLIKVPKACINHGGCF